MYCDQTAGCTRIPLCTEVDLGPGDIVLDGEPAPPKRGIAPTFRPCLLWPNGWLDQDATWYGGRPRLKPHCVRLGPSSPPTKKEHSPLHFWPISVVAKWSPMSATVEHLFEVTRYRPPADSSTPRAVRPSASSWNFTTVCSQLSDYSR